MAVIRGTKVYINLYDKWGNSIGAIELEPRVVDGLPSKGTRKGELIFNTQDSKIYYWDGSAWRTFGLEEHTHVRADITDFWATPFWDNIPDKPSTFPPEAHTHPRSDITDFWAAPFWSNIPDKPSMHRGFSYIIFEEDGTIKAIDGRTGRTLTEGTDPATVINYVFQNVSDGDSVVIIGDFTITSPLVLQDKNHVKVFQYGTLTAGSGLTDYMIKVIYSGSGYGAKFNKLFIDKLYGNGNCNGILLQNAYNNEIILGEIENVVKGITIAAYNGWSESTKIRSGQISATQYGVGFEILAGDTGSFVNTLIDNVSFGVYQYGIYIPEGAHVESSVFLNPHGWVNANNAIMIYMKGTVWGLLIIDPHFEDVNGNYSGEKMIYTESGDFVLINPHTANIDALIDSPNHMPFIIIDKQYIYFANYSPATYGGIRNYYNSFMIGWRLTQDSDEVLNIFPPGRTNVLWSWADTQTWQKIFAIYGDGRTEAKILQALTDLRIPTSQPSNPVAGSMYFDPSTGKLYVYDGSTWKSVTLT